MRKLKLFLAFLLVVIPLMPVLPATAAPKAGTAPQYTTLTPPSEHPRLYLRQGDIPAMRERWERSDSQLPSQIVWFRNQMKTAQANYTSGLLPISVGAAGNAVKQIDFSMQTNALEYLMYRDDPEPAMAEAAIAKGRLAIKMAKQYLTSFNWGPGMDLYSRNYLIGPCLVNTACVFDWCYDLLTDADKAVFLDRYSYLVNYFEENGDDQGVRTAGASQNSFPNSGLYNVGLVNGHNVEEQIPTLLALAIATYGEESLYWEAMSDTVFNHYIPTQASLLQQGAYWQGNSYGPARYMHAARVNYLAYMMQTPGSRKSLLNEKATRDVAYSFLYYRRPDGKLFQMGDMFVYSDPHGQLQSHGEQNSLMYVNALYDDPYIQTELNRLFKAKTQRVIEVVEGFLLWSEVDPKPYEGNLPQYLYMPSPRGEMIATTGWYDVTKENGGGVGDGVDFNSNAMMVDMKVGERWMGNHDHFDAGSFQVYYKGTLAHDAGFYESRANGGYGTPSDTGWTKNTISHNSILIYDKDLYKKFDPIDGGGFPWYFDRYYNVAWKNPGNGGGQRPPDGGMTPQNTYLDADGNVVPAYKFNDGTDPGWPNEQDWHSGKVLAHAVQPGTLAPEYSYLKGDLANLYTYRAEEVNRSFLFFDFKNGTYPGALLVFDRITTTDPDYQKIFTLHSVEKPTIDPVTGEITIRRTETVTGGTYNGQMVTTPVLPAADNLNIDQVHGYVLPDGTSFDALMGNGAGRPSEEISKYMLQLSPKTPSKTDLMLNVMQCQDVGVDPLDVTKVGGEDQDLVGARIVGGGVDYVGLFASGGKLLSKAVSIPAAGSSGGIAHYVVADLAAGSWTVTDKSGAFVASFTVADEQNIGEFHGSAAAGYTLTPGKPVTPKIVAPNPGTAPKLVSAEAFLEKITLTFNSPLADSAFDKDAFTVSGVRSIERQNNRDPYNIEAMWGTRGPNANFISSWPKEWTPIENSPIVTAYITQDKMHVVLSLQHATMCTDKVKVSYSGAGGLTSLGGTVAGFTKVVAKNTNIVPFDSKPSVNKIIAQGNKVTIYFSRALYDWAYANGWGREDANGNYSNLYTETLGLEENNQPDSAAFTVSGSTVTSAALYGEVLVLTLDKPTTTLDTVTIRYKKTGRHNLTDGRNLFDHSPYSEVDNFTMTAKNINVAQAPGIVKTMTRGFVTNGVDALSATGIPLSLLSSDADPTLPSLTDIGIVCSFGKGSLAATGVAKLTVNGVPLQQGVHFVLDKMPYSLNSKAPEVGMNAFGDLVILKKEALLRLPGPITKAVVEITFNDAAKTIGTIEFPYTDNR